ncbi:von Willebrand factor A domain-containing protein 7-like isoform X1 [Sphaeramia orbicularis]|nr:von Willebrand factor A domain-containing protein 7-like isoform X1 [Sphaeramia orbicularis]XP_029986619.1 von Willebrand factor A domain-containing protein 7-like isoform X1 [Sphaeramia orbicularis]
MFGSAVLCFLLLQTGVLAFHIDQDDSLNHQEITESAILSVTLQACRSLALSEGRDFSFPPQPYEAASVAQACRPGISSKSFAEVIELIQDKNVKVDKSLTFFSAKHHFDNELFNEGRALIIEGLGAVKASNREGNFQAARKRLGKILHSLQDFYSHSNWIEMGNKRPNTNLLRGGTSIGNIADRARATCRSCDGDDCTNNILEDVLRDKILTSGYFKLWTFFPRSKPAGKCSHGGFFDGTSRTEPKGGINKDKVDSSHGHLHFQAADVAIAATSELLEDVRRAAGDRVFLEMMGISTGKPLCFCIDTTGSMSDDIDAVKTVTSSIINSKAGTAEEPSIYILVPFNDPDFGPLIRTTNPTEFKTKINALTATGGGDAPEMALSGLQLALTGAPPNSEIFLFTDAPAKDRHLLNTVNALIERTKTVVNIMLTGIIGLRGERSTNHGQYQLSRMLSSDAQLFRDLAEASGGLAIEVSKSQLLEATSIVVESSSSTLVTLLKVARSSGGESGNFTFTVDDSVKNLTIYITGGIDKLTLTSPSGVSQEGTTGPLVTSSQFVGNFHTVRLIMQVGLWKMTLVSANAYTLKVVGQSPIDFFFTFVEPSRGLFGGFDTVDNRPRAGVNGTLMVTVTGSNSAIVTDVVLVESSGPGEVNGSVENQDGKTFLVHFDRIPSQAFVVLVKGQIGNSSSRLSSVRFQRQSTTSLKASSLSITADDSDGIIEPGTTFSVPFSVRTSGAGGTVNIQAVNDQGFTSTFPSTLVLESGDSANGTVNITAPVNTTSGTEVTLTIEAQTSDGSDANYVVLSLSVLKTVTDFTPPVCKLLTLQSNCSDGHNSSMWALTLQVTDGINGTGVDRISLRQGNGTLNTTLSPGDNNTIAVSYTAPCSSPTVELVVVDRVGNVDTCIYSVIVTTKTPMTTKPLTTMSQSQTTTSQSLTTTPQSTTSFSTRVVQSSLLCFTIVILSLGFNLPG